MSMGQTSAINPPKCHWCGRTHEGIRCPEASAIEYYQDGSVKRVEFVQPQANYAWMNSFLVGAQSPVDITSDA